MEKRGVQTDAAPKAVGPYSQAIVAGNMVFCSGQIGIDPHTHELVGGGVQEQARQALQNLVAVLEAAGSSTSDVVSTTLYLTSMDDFSVVNDLYATFFSSNPLPARATVEVSRLPKEALFEVSCIAFRTIH